MTALLEARCCDGQVRGVGAALPGLIRDVHTSINAGREVAELLDLAVLVHAQLTEAWLRIAGAPVQLREQAAVLARRAAQRRATPTAMSLSLTVEVDVALAAGDFDLARAEMNRVSVPTRNPELTQLAGLTAAKRSFMAAATSRPRVRGRRDDVVRALRRAETLVPHAVQRNPAARETLAELLTYAKRGDAVRLPPGCGWTGCRPRR